MYNAVIGQNIRNQRKRKGFSQEELAEAVGVSRQTIVNWENGKVMPLLENIEEMCRIFNVSYEELAGKSKLEDASTEAEEIAVAEAEKEDVCLTDEKKSKKLNAVQIALLSVLALISLAVMVVSMMIMIPTGDYDIRTFAFSFGFGENEILLTVVILSLAIFVTATGLLIIKCLRKKKDKSSL